MRPDANSRQKSRRRLARIGYFAACSAISATLAQAAPLKIGLDDYCPYYCKADSPGEDRLAELPGFAIEILQHAFGSGPNDINYRFLPWKRSVLEVTQGRLDAIVMITQEEAPELIYPNIEQGRSQGCFFALHNAPWRYTGAESLAQVRLSLISGYLFGEPLNSYLKLAQKDQPVEYISGNQALLRIFQMIELGRTQATAEDSMVATYLLQASGFKQRIGNVGCYPGYLDFYVGFAPNNPDSSARAKKLAETMIALRSTGELSKILARYGLSDWR
ncbi:MAG: ABC transporter substrate-binding protein [Pseudomonadaceae bacterium]|jgi:polar amino acid transport system substrate-binding protein|nr:ABC transporter substrate-binding protein [Pseudomonadaceae bacterium]